MYCVFYDNEEISFTNVSLASIKLISQVLTLALQANHDTRTFQTILGHAYVRHCGSQQNSKKGKRPLDFSTAGIAWKYWQVRHAFCVYD
jgi:hypothetical protein